jgi:hypothetical protein
MTTYDFLKGLDLTGQGNVSPSELNQLIDNASFTPDRGIILTTKDAGGIPDVPDASFTTKWQNYIWRRVLADAIYLYTWDESAEDDPDFFKWVRIDTVMKQQLYVFNSVVSPELGLPLLTAGNTTLEWEHGLSGMPDNYRVVLKYYASQSGVNYSLGDEVPSELFITQKKVDDVYENYPGVQILVDNVKFTLIFPVGDTPDEDPTVRIMNKDSLELIPIIYSRFKAKIYAQRNTLTTV